MTRNREQEPTGKNCEGLGEGRERERESEKKACKTCSGIFMLVSVLDSGVVYPDRFILTALVNTQMSITLIG